MNIVIVEDEYRTRNGLVNLIQKLSPQYKVAGSAETGAEGLRLIRELNPDVVIADVEMPGMSGLKMIEEAKQIGVTSKFIILSGHAEFKYAQRAIQLSISEYLLKPVSVEELTKLLAMLYENFCGAKSRRTEDFAQSGPYSKIVRDMLQTIQSDYGKPLSLESFALKYKRTSEYLSTIFTKEIGYTFSHYIKRIRLEKAKEFLVQTDMKIYEIAIRVGYPDQKYFSKLFKEYTGVSAKQYAADQVISVKE